jgi:phytoene synthase
LRFFAFSPTGSNVTLLDQAVDLDESYRYCRVMARREARNFYYSFMVLPPERRAALCAIYAFMRYSDDISDDEAVEAGSRTARMAAWREALHRAFAGDYGDSRILPAFHDTARRYGVPQRYFDELIDGAEMDLVPRRYETFADLYRYCYHVASVVGLVCIHVFGFSDPRATDLAEACGIGFQLTNILRDLPEDMERDRVYLPQEDLRRFGYTEEDLRAGRVDERFLALMRFQVARAEEYYRQSEPLIGLIEPASRPCLRAMRQIYHGILERIVAQEYDVFRTRARVPTWGKLGIAARAWLEARGVGRWEPSSAS